MITAPIRGRLEFRSGPMPAATTDPDTGDLLAVFDVPLAKPPGETRLIPGKVSTHWHYRIRIADGTLVEQEDCHGNRFGISCYLHGGDNLQIWRDLSDEEQVDDIAAYLGCSREVAAKALRIGANPIEAARRLRR